MFGVWFVAGKTKLHHIGIGIFSFFIALIAFLFCLLMAFRLCQ